MVSHKWTYKRTFNQEQKTSGVERKELSISSRKPMGWRGMEVGKGGYK